MKGYEVNPDMNGLGRAAGFLAARGTNPQWLAAIITTLDSEETEDGAKELITDCIRNKYSGYKIDDVMVALAVCEPEKALQWFKMATASIRGDNAFKMSSWYSYHNPQYVAYVVLGIFEAMNALDRISYDLGEEEEREFAKLIFEVLLSHDSANRLERKSYFVGPDEMHKQFEERLDKGVKGYLRKDTSSRPANSRHSYIKEAFVLAKEQDQSAVPRTALGMPYLEELVLNALVYGIVGSQTSYATMAALSAKKTT